MSNRYANRPLVSSDRDEPPQRPRRITERRMRPPEPANVDPQQPPCPCCQQRAATRAVVKHGVECTGCAHVVWVRE